MVLEMLYYIRQVFAFSGYMICEGFNRKISKYLELSWKGQIRTQATCRGFKKKSETNMDRSRISEIPPMPLLGHYFDFSSLIFC